MPRGVYVRTKPSYTRTLEFRQRESEDRRRPAVAKYRKTRLGTGDRDGVTTHEHIVVAERALGKPLPKGSPVHHVNGVKTDNRNRNLVICQDAAYHNLLHKRQRIVNAGGDPDREQICCGCKVVKSLDQFYWRDAAHTQRQGRCRTCYADAYQRKHHETTVEEEAA